MRRDGVHVARCTVRRLMGAMGLAGALRGLAWTTTAHAGEVIRRQGPWRNLEAVAFATPTRVDRFNTRRLLGPIGDAPPG